MFLITTADQQFWKDDGKVLFLGEWCKLYPEQKHWQKLDSSTLPYHWADKDKQYKDFHYLDSLYEKYLSVLANELNQLHSVSHSKRYWRIVIGHWLSSFIEVLYDRYESILQAKNNYSITNTIIPSYDLENFIPEDLDHFSLSLRNENLNHILFSEIIKFVKDIPYTEIDHAQDYQRLEPIPKVKANFKQNLILKYLQWYAKKPNCILFIATYLKPLDEIALQLKLKQTPAIKLEYLFKLISFETLPNNLAMRNSLLTNIKTDIPFEQLLVHLIPKMIPNVHIESYQAISQKAVSIFPAKPRAVLTSNLFAYCEPFKLWIAAACERKTKYIISQHGGFYNSGLFSRHEKLEKASADAYFTWGAKLEKVDHPLPSGKLYKYNVKPNPKGDILWISLPTNRYTCLMYSGHLSSEYTHYLDDQKQFHQTLSTPVQDLLRVRLYIADFEWCVKEHWQALKNPPKFSTHAKMDDDFNESRLCICTYNATTYLEAFAANFPTLLFWDPTQWRQRESAQPYFDLLKQAGILHDTPESLANKLNEIYEDPQTWWMQEKIQDAKNQFCKQFADTSPDWRNKWKNEILKITNDS